MAEWILKRHGKTTTIILYRSFDFVAVKFKETLPKKNTILKFKHPKNECKKITKQPQNKTEQKKNYYYNNIRRCPSLLHVINYIILPYICSIRNSNVKERTSNNKKIINDSVFCSLCPDRYPFFSTNTHTHTEHTLKYIFFLYTRQKINI